MMFRLITYPQFKAAQFDDVVSSSFTAGAKPAVARKLSSVFTKRLYQWNVRRKLKSAREFIRTDFPDIYEIQLRNRQDGGLASEMQWLRLAEIHQLVDYFKPSSVLEFGSGTSSCMFARLLKDRGRFCTFEENTYWYERMRDAAGPFAPLMEARNVGRRIIVHDKGESVTCYDIDTYESFDMVYVDGPTGTNHENVDGLTILDPKKKKLMPNIDVERMWTQKIFPKVIVVDGRRPTVRRLIHQNPGCYSLYLKSKFGVALHLTSSARYLHHSVFVRDY